MKILLEVNIGGEESKWGFKPDEVENAVREISNLSGIKICGLMTIPPICEEEHEVRKYFRQMYKLFIDIGSKNIDNSSMDILSMGMSDDFDIAIEEGANLVRVGTALFGKRNYNV
jgi:pyridoxal phosphate enzyme (YggS family)